MKKFIQKIMLAFACFSLGVGIAVSPITASAEDIPETSIEEVIPETSVPEEETPLPETSETPEEKVDTTFEDFLAWAQKEADRYGYGEDFAGAIEAIKAAASQKQVTLSTLASAALALVIVAYIVVKHFKEKGYKNAITRLVKTFDGKIDNAIKGTNALIDGENAIIEDGTANGKTVKETQDDVQSLKRCMTAFISAFLRFTDGVKLGDNKKTEVQSNLLSALKELETGKGAQDENNAH